MCKNFGFFWFFFSEKVQNFRLKSRYWQSEKNVQVVVNVCFHMKSPYQWSDACPWSYKHKHIKIFHFSEIFGRKSPIIPLKIEISKIRKHRHVAEDVCFHIKPSHDNSHAHPKRSVGAVWGHPHFRKFKMASGRPS